MIIDGKKIAEELREKIKGDIKKISDNKKSGLAVILIGEHPASQIYVRNKEKFANEVGINSSVLRFDENISEDEFLERLVEKMEVNPKEFIEFINNSEVKQRLIDNTQNLIDRGGFGSPTFFLDVDDMYFGNDRLQLIEKII